MLPITIQYFIDVLSQWCLISDKALLSVRMRYGDRLPVRYRFVPISGRDPIYVDLAGQRTAYERSTFITGVKTIPWLQGEARSTWQANVAVVAAEELGVDIERARLAVSSAALLEGVSLGEDGVASAFLASRFGLDQVALDRAMESDAVQARMHDDLSAFARYGLTVRPSFVIENEIGDWTILNGGHREALISEAVSSLLMDGTGYEWYVKHLG
ncbi:MAG: DsbA family protein [Candidatus Cybelea sp.]